MTLEYPFSILMVLYALFCLYMLIDLIRVEQVNKWKYYKESPWRFFILFTTFLTLFVVGLITAYHMLQVRV